MEVLMVHLTDTQPTSTAMLRSRGEIGATGRHAAKPAAMGDNLEAEAVSLRLCTAMARTAETAMKDRQTLSTAIATLTVVQLMVDMAHGPPGLK